MVPVVIVTLPTTREPLPKSARFASIPESTIAIVGACGPGLAAVPQSFATPVSYGHIWFELGVPASWTEASGVMVRPGCFARAASFPAVMSTATAPIRSKRLRTSAPRPTSFVPASLAPAAL